MNVCITEDLSMDTTENRDDATSRTSTALDQRQHTQAMLAEPQEAFLRDRFRTKLEDPATGQWIRSWRTNGE